MYGMMTSKQIKQSGTMDTTIHFEQYNHQLWLGNSYKHHRSNGSTYYHNFIIETILQKKCTEPKEVISEG